MIACARKLVLKSKASRVLKKPVAQNLVATSLLEQLGIFLLKKMATSESSSCSSAHTTLMAVLDFIALLCQAGCMLALSAYRAFIPEPKKSVRSRVVLITGAGHGLGRLLALKFADLGAKIVLWDLDEAKNNSVLEEIKSSGHEAWAYKCDVSNEQQVKEAGKKLRHDVGPVHILINNAGILPGQSILKLQSSQIKKTLEVNTLAHFWTIRQFLPAMLEMGEGHIVAISSVAGLLGCANLTDYCASKFGTVGLMAALREDLYEQGQEELINLTIVCPSVMDTGLVQKPRTRFPSICPVLKVEDAADIIRDGILRNKRAIVIPGTVHTIYKIAMLFPSQVTLMVQRFFDYTMDANRS